MYIYLNLSIERPLLETGFFATSCQVERTKMLRLLLFVAVYACAVLASKRTLVLVDNWSIRETHSVYFRTLRGEFISVKPRTSNFPKPGRGPCYEMSTSYRKKLGFFMYIAWQIFRNKLPCVFQINKVAPASKLKLSN